MFELSLQGRMQGDASASNRARINPRTDGLELRRIFHYSNSAKHPHH